MIAPLAELLTGLPSAPERTVALHHGRAITRMELRRRVAGLAGRLGEPKRVLLACREAHHFVIGLYAAWHAGCRVMVAPNCLPATLQRLAAETDILLSDDGIAAGQPSDGDLSRIDPAKAGVVLFTSGSTGEAKRFERSLDALEREARILEECWGRRLADAPVLATVSHQHLFGLTFRICWPLFAGRPFESRAHDIWESLLADIPGGAVLISSPAHLDRLAGILPLAAERRPRAVFSAGARLPARAFEDSRTILGCAPTEIFGSTESGAVASRYKPDDDWRLLPGHRLLNAAEGRLRLYSPYDEAIVETADRIAARPGGFQFLGRLDRIVKIAGKRVSLAEVEAALCALPEVFDAASLLLPGEDRLGAVVTLTGQGWTALQDLGHFRFTRSLRQELSSLLEPAARPKSFRFVEALPSGPLGKASPADLRTLFAGTVHP